MYKITVNDKFKFEIASKSPQLSVNNDTIEADILKIGAAGYHIIKNNKSYRAEVVSLDRQAKTASVKINGNLYEVGLKDEYDTLLDQLGLSSLTSGTVSDLKAPMPGLVLKVFVKENDTVKKGDNLFVLEAMKMENIIKAPADAIVKAVKIKPGDKVEKGQILIAF